MPTNYLLCVVGLFFCTCLFAQEVQIDSQLRPYLKDFFKSCKAYDIPYREKLFSLEHIDVVDTLSMAKEDATLGRLIRNESGTVTAIAISWMAQIDPEILKIVAYHEFAHYFLEYDTHVCDDCNKIMAVYNTSYFDITRDWNNQVKILFEESPIYQRKLNGLTASAGTNTP